MSGMSITNRIKKLYNHQGFKKYFANTSWLFGEKILRLLVGFTVGVWVARYLGPKDYGLLSYAQSFVGLFGAFASLGLDGIVVREIVKSPEKENEILGTAFILKLAGSVFTLLLLFIAIQFTSNDFFTNLLVFIIASGFIFQSFNVIDMYFQAKVMSKYAVLANSASLFISSIIKIILILLKAPLIAFAIVIVIDNIILSLGYLYWYFQNRKEIFFKKVRFNVSIAKNLLKDSWPLILSSVAVSIYMKIDQVMIKEMLTSKDVGIYAVAVKLSEVWYFIPAIITNSLFPAIINAKKVNENLYYQRLQKLFDFMVVIALVMAIFITLFGKSIITFLYGISYYEAANVLKIYIWSSLFIFLFVTSGKWLIIENLTKKAFYRNLAGAIINIVLNIPLIKLLGSKGAAISTLISYAVSGFFYDVFDKDLRKIFVIKLKALLFINLASLIFRRF